MKFRFPCESPCKAGWNKPGPLNRHQKTCEHWRAYEVSMLDLRAESASEPPKKRRKTSRKEVRHLVCSSQQFLRHFVAGMHGWYGLCPNGRRRNADARGIYRRTFSTATASQHANTYKFHNATPPDSKTARTLSGRPSRTPRSRTPYSRTRTEASNGVPDGHQSPGNCPERFWPLPQLPFPPIL